MTNVLHKQNEQAVEKAFNRQAPVFDQIYSIDTIVAYKRDRVRDHVLHFLLPNSNILELNAGTGEDAVFFAQCGHTVHATDISDNMQIFLRKKVLEKKMGKRVSNEVCSFTNLNALTNRGPFDLVFSNFAGLNCTSELEHVLSGLDELVKPGGLVTLVVLPNFCLWEFLLLLRGKWKTALRRFSGTKGAKAHIEGEYFRCWYYNPSTIQRYLGPNFELVSLEGLCTIVPPSYMTGFAEKHSTLFRFLKKAENKLRTTWPWRSIGDYYIISCRKSQLIQD